MKKILLFILIPQLILAQSRSPEIQSWTEITVKKGYILSIDLYKEKQCSKIWSKQIKEFKKHNTHIKNANLIFVNQKIKVQNCKIEFKETSNDKINEIKQEYSPIQLKTFMGIYVGASYIASRNEDTEKRGYTIGIKYGKSLRIIDQSIGVSIGYLYNQERTTNENDYRGVYIIKNQFLTLEAEYLKDIGSKWQVGPMMNLVLSDDVSMKDHKGTQNVGLFAGIEALYQINKKYQLELNLQQSIDDINRPHLLGNIGLKFDLK